MKRVNFNSFHSPKRIKLGPDIRQYFNIEKENNKNIGRNDGPTNGENGSAASPSKLHTHNENTSQTNWTALLRKPFEYVEWKFPVTFHTFKCYTIWRNVVDRILEDFKAETGTDFRHDELMRERVLKNYYLQFYTNQYIRNQYPIEVTKCSTIKRKKILKFGKHYSKRENNSASLTKNMCVANSLENESTPITETHALLENRRTILVHEMGLTVNFLKNYIKTSLDEDDKREKVLEEIRKSVLRNKQFWDVKQQDTGESHSLLTEINALVSPPVVENKATDGDQFEAFEVGSKELGSAENVRESAKIVGFDQKSEEQETSESHSLVKEMNALLSPPAVENKSTEAELANKDLGCAENVRESFNMVPLDQMSEHSQLTKYCLPYMLRFHRGLKRHIIAAIMQMNFEDFKIYTRIQGIPHSIIDTNTLKYYFDCVFVKPQVWFGNLYMPLLDLYRYLKLKKVPFNSWDLSVVSPRFLHFEELSIYTDFDECVILDYYRRKGEKIECSIDIFENLRKSYYAKCWWHDEWAWRTPKVNVEKVLGDNLQEMKSVDAQNMYRAENVQNIVTDGKSLEEDFAEKVSNMVTQTKSIDDHCDEAESNMVTEVKPSKEHCDEDVSTLGTMDKSIGELCVNNLPLIQDNDISLEVSKNDETHNHCARKTIMISRLVTECLIEECEEKSEDSSYGAIEIVHFENDLGEVVEVYEDERTTNERLLQGEINKARENDEQVIGVTNTRLMNQVPAEDINMEQKGQETRNNIRNSCFRIEMLVNNTTNNAEEFTEELLLEGSNVANTTKKLGGSKNHVEAIRTGRATKEATFVPVEGYNICTATMNEDKGATSSQNQSFRNFDFISMPNTQAQVDSLPDQVDTPQAWDTLMLELFPELDEESQQRQQPEIIEQSFGSEITKGNGFNTTLNNDQDEFTSTNNQLTEILTISDSESLNERQLQQQSSEKSHDPSQLNNCTQPLQLRQDVPEPQDVPNSLSIVKFPCNKNVQQQEQQKQISQQPQALRQNELYEQNAAAQLQQLYQQVLQQLSARQHRFQQEVQHGQQPVQQQRLEQELELLQQLQLQIQSFSEVQHSEVPSIQPYLTYNEQKDSHNDTLPILTITDDYQTESRSTPSGKVIFRHFYNK